MKIGIMGGSFNPIHVGHAIISNYITQNTDVEQLWLMVSPLNPFKVGQSMASDYHRLCMTEMVARRLDKVITSGFEFGLPRPSYTIDTLHELQAKFPDDEFVLVIGADNWTSFKQWKDYQEIIDNHSIIVYPRQGYEVSIPDEYRDRVKLVNAPLVEVSSSYIRAQIAKGMNMSFYLPDEVYEYIIKNRLYM